MKIEHIVWEDYYGYEDAVEGLLEIEVYWHGGDRDTFIAEGTYDNDRRGSFKNRFLGEINQDTMGVSGVNLIRVGRIVE